MWKTKIYLLTFCILQMSCATKLDFNQFENFVKNARTFQEEKKLISELKSLKVILQNVKGNIQNQELHKLQDNLERISNWYRRCDQNIHKMNTHFPTKSDLNGALKGMLILQETYQLDPKDFLKGQIIYKNQIFKSRYSMTVQDLEKLTKLAFKYEWFDNSITFLKAINSTENKDILQLKNNLIKVHNKLVMARKARISKKSKVFPFIVNNNLVKKSKQPKSLQNIDW